MWNVPTQNQLSRIPALYSSEETPEKDKIIYMKFFIGGTTWYIAEYDPSERIFYGFTILNQDIQNAEWGYISLDELIGIRVSFVQVDREVNWKPKRAEEIAEIAMAMDIKIGV